MKSEMFTDKRSKKVIFVAHCILNQNAKSDGTASYPSVINEVLELISSTDMGIVQMPCPELHCLGLDRGNIKGGTRPVLEENSRIRNVISSNDTIEKVKHLTGHVAYQISEYLKHGFEVKGVIGINRSPSCGVDSTSKDNEEISGEGVFIKELGSELTKNDININMIGIKVFEPEKAIAKIKELLDVNVFV